MRIDVLIENYSQNHLLCEHGLSFLIHYHDKVYLLDAGKSGSFIDNANTLGFDLKTIHQCILSHGHYDHSDGFIHFLNLYPDKKIYAGKSVFDDYYSSSDNMLHYIGLDERLKEKKDSFIPINQVTCIDDGVYLIPHQYSKYTVNKNLYRKCDNDYVLDDFKHELSLVFVEEDELVVLNSCSHVGMLTVIEDLSCIFKYKKIKAYFGGLHMKGKDKGQEICVYSDKQIEDISQMIRQNNMMVYTGHCTGKIAFDKLKVLSSENIYPLYSGLSVVL